MLPPSTPHRLAITLLLGAFVGACRESGPPAMATTAPAASPRSASAPRSMSAGPNDGGARPRESTSSTPPMRSVPHPRSATKCTRTREEFCPRGCWTYDDALASALRARADASDASECTGIGSGDVAVGVCGEHRFVENGDCLSGMTEFFDARGVFVGAYAWSDVRRSCGSATLIGFVPACPP